MIATITRTVPEGAGHRLAFSAWTMAAVCAATGPDGDVLGFDLDDPGIQLGLASQAFPLDASSRYIAAARLLAGQTFDKFHFKAVPTMAQSRVTALFRRRRMARQARQPAPVWHARPRIESPGGSHRLHRGRMARHPDDLSSAKARGGSPRVQPRGRRQSHLKLCTSVNKVDSMRISGDIKVAMRYFLIYFYVL